MIDDESGESMEPIEEVPLLPLVVRSIAGIYSFEVAFPFLTRTRL